MVGSAVLDATEDVIVDAARVTALGHKIALQRTPLCSEIALWLIAGNVDLEAQCKALHDGDDPPYWAFCWGSGQALARWVLDHPENVRGRRVVDFGAGSGIAGIAAARAGAASVVAVDVDPVARRVAAANARANAVRIETALAVPREWDLLVASDVLYQQGSAATIAALCGIASGSGRQVVVAEPERPGSRGYPGEPVRRYEARTFPDVDSPTRAARIHRLV